MRCGNQQGGGRGVSILSEVGTLVNYGPLGTEDRRYCFIGEIVGMLFDVTEALTAYAFVVTEC